MFNTGPAFGEAIGSYRGDPLYHASLDPDEYDGLLARFGWDLPAVGFSFTLDRILPLLADVTRLQVPLHEAEQHEIATPSGDQTEFFRQAWELRQRGLRVRLGTAVP